jgi:glycine/D-amino acid oxidase-like deaminating enzyme
VKISRRQFLESLLGAAAATTAAGLSWLRWKPRRSFTGGIVGANWKTGHLMRDGKLPPPTEHRRERVVIVGGGIAGLSAAWKFLKSGYDDFKLLELEDEVGGNSRSGQNSISAYPWGAHYVPLPGPEMQHVRELFKELGVIEGYDPGGLPIYNEYYLCAEPQERLFVHGRWQEGFVPQTGISASDRRQYQEFFATMETFKSATGEDGRRAFVIPVDLSSRDPNFLRFDNFSMARYLDQNHWDSEYLRWYVNYCCRDDYGSTMETTSAWAGIHYFASRVGKAANAESGSLVTWPAGNGWIAQRLKEKAAGHLQPAALVFNVEQHGNETFVDYYDVTRRCTVRVVADAVVFAAPRFVACKAIKELRERADAFASFEYSPWMVANISVDSMPSLFWDNVLYRSDSLGYVVATHQDVSVYPKRKTVLTYYLPLSSVPPAQARFQALNRSYSEWSDLIVRDLSHAHPDLESHITHLDVWLWGHAMIRPTPGFIWGETRRAALQPLDNIFFAHSDMSGISIFEEAQYRGVTAAEQVMSYLKENRSSPEAI